MIKSLLPLARKFFKICQFTLQGILIREWGNIGKPYGIAVDQNEIFIADHSTNELLVFSEDGRKLRNWKTNSLNGGIAISDDFVYVTALAETCTRVFSRNGNYVFQFKLPDSNARPGGIVVSNDMAYISDAWSNKVYKFAIE